MKKPIASQTWHATPSSGGQGLVIESETGRSVAVTYQLADAPAIAMLPRLLDVLDTISMGNSDPDRMASMAKEVLNEIAASVAELSRDEENKEGVQLPVDSEAKPSLPRIVETPGLQWLVLPDESENGYTNWGNLSPNDASVVNCLPSLGMGRSDWRLPTVGELLPLVGTPHAPKDGAYWTSCLCADDSDLAQVVDFSVGSEQAYHRNDDICRVRLVRSIQ